MIAPRRYSPGTLVTAGGTIVYRVLSTRRSTLAGWQHELSPVTGGVTIYRFGEALTEVAPPARPSVADLVTRSPARLGIIQGGKP
ncbi:hypothetical protein [Zavarzinia aquatilis]|uniref:Uncharacterized protein n=1 Tax=Zavarzinia aquatilis TaxID=2211142 RepID=A0A317EGK8_9PROT|nr:hypothetical protein [Zavarzinia aquatilis]PWR24543.1 hypothetical protein DKG74_06985 [Zavarzinia aquatilis]